MNRPRRAGSAGSVRLPQLHRSVFSDSSYLTLDLITRNWRQRAIRPALRPSVFKEFHRLETDRCPSKNLPASFGTPATPGRAAQKPFILRCTPAA